MALRLSRFLSSALIAFCSANIAAGTIIYLGLFSPQAGRQAVDGSLAGAMRDFAGLDAQGWLAVLHGAGVTSALLAVATLVPVALFVAAAWRFRWRNTPAIVATAACIGPLMLAAGLLALSSAFPQSLANPALLTFYGVLAAAGAIASLVFWLIMKPALPWLSHQPQAAR